MSRKAIIIGAGPAGLTAAYELLKRTAIKPIIIEKDKQVGGISKTVDYKGNKMDFGPHRFFSKSDRVMNWWTNIMPLFTPKGEDLTIGYQNKSRKIDTNDFLTIQEEADGLPPAKSMLIIPRLTRIYFLRQFFMYPIQLSIATLGQLGIVTTIKIIFSYLYARLFPRKPQKSLEDFMINKFGNVLYRIFFKDYTEKVWGKDCKEISAEWGAQRVKGVSLSKAVLHAAKVLAGKKKKKSNDINQKETETSLIEQFLYPAKGAGAIWEEVARQVVEMGGKIVTHYDVKHLQTSGDQIIGVEALNTQTKQIEALEGDYFISTMPVQELVAGLKGNVPESVKEVAAGLMYRDFVYAGVLVKKMTMETPKDSWIYMQERDVKVARMQVYNNWGPYMVADPNTVWLGLEYFCNKGDEIWNLTDEEVEKLAISELIQMKLVNAGDVLDAKVNRMEKTYPAYFGTYDRFEEIRHYLDNFENLFLVGRNGMHKYNNADHSMLTAMVAVDNIYEGVTSKENLWNINTEQDYHEEKTPPVAPVGQPVSAPQVQPSFGQFIWRDKWNRGYTLFAFIAFVIQFAFFKQYYPYANYMPDSYAYLEAAAINADVNMWPVAYSKFLRLFSVFTHSDVLLTGFQYMFMVLSGMVFLFTLLYFFNPGKWVKGILLVFFIFNPIALYISNYISADAIFIGLSLHWISQLIWIIYRPKPYMILTQAVLLLTVFTVRYNAIYYPLIAALAFILSKQAAWRKVVGIGLGLLLIGWSIWFTSNKMYKETGHRQFSAFGGWQLANNALYMYEHIPQSERRPVPTKFAKLEKMVQQHFDTLSRVKMTKADSLAGYFYLWSERGPLHQYMLQETKKDSPLFKFERWASVAPEFREYAFLLIRHYPMQFANNFLLTNSVKFAVPPTEFLGIYNMGADSVNRLAKDWFNYKTQVIKKNNAKSRSKISIIHIYPVFLALANVLYLFSLIGMLIFNGFKTMHKISILIFSLWVLNMLFSVFASPIVLRYQVLFLFIVFNISVLSVGKIVQMSRDFIKVEI